MPKHNNEASCYTLNAKKTKLRHECSSNTGLNQPVPVNPSSYPGFFAATPPTPQGNAVTHMEIDELCNLMMESAIAAPPAMNSPGAST